MPVSFDRGPERAPIDLGWHFPEWWLACVSLLAAGCSSSAPDRGPTFVVEVHGGKESLETYELTSPQLEGAEPLVFTGNTLARRLWTRMPWSDLSAQHIELRATKQGVQTSSVVTAPFLCAPDPMFARRLADGWKIVETHQVFLDPQGVLWLDTDFEHRLVYQCEESTPDGRDGDGTGTIVHEQPVCTDDRRSSTSIKVHGMVAGQSVEETMTTCWATLDDVAEGQIGLQLLAYPNFGSVSLGLTHCLSSPAEAFPADFQVRSAARCPTGASAIVREGHGPERALQTQGSWTISSVSFAKGGHIVGQINFEASNESGDSLRIEGAYDLPMVRVPVEGDWLP